MDKYITFIRKTIYCETDEDNNRVIIGRKYYLEGIEEIPYPSNAIGYDINSLTFTYEGGMIARILFEGSRPYIMFSIDHEFKSSSLISINKVRRECF